MTTARDKFFYTRTLCSLLKALEGVETELELRNDSHVRGTVELVGADMSVTMCNCELIVAGRLKKLQRLFVQGRKIRMVLIPDEINMIGAIQDVIKMFNAPVKGRCEFKKISRGKGRGRGLGRGQARRMFDRGRARGLGRARGRGGTARGGTEYHYQGVTTSTSETGPSVRGRGFVGRGRPFVHRGRGSKSRPGSGRDTFHSTSSVSTEAVDDLYQNQSATVASEVSPGCATFPTSAKETSNQSVSGDSDNRTEVVGSMLRPDYIYNKLPQQTPKTDHVSVRADSHSSSHSVQVTKTVTKSTTHDTAESSLGKTDLRHKIRKSSSTSSGMHEERNKSQKGTEELPHRHVHDLGSSSKSRAKESHRYRSPKRHFPDSSSGKSKSHRTRSHDMPKSGNPASDSEHRSSRREESPSKRRHSGHSSRSRHLEREYRIHGSSKHFTCDRHASPSTRGGTVGFEHRKQYSVSSRHKSPGRDISSPHSSGGKSPSRDDSKSRSSRSSPSSRTKRTSTSSEHHYQCRSNRR